MYAEAISTYQRGISRAEPNPKLIASLAHAYAMSGDRDKAFRTLDELRELSKKRYFSPLAFAVVYAGLDEKDEMFAWLEKAYQARPADMLWLSVDPIFEFVHDDPRFKDLVKRIGV